MKHNFYRRMWFLATLYNVVGGIGIFIAAPWLFSSVGEAVPSPPLYYQAWIAMFATIGIGYWFVYRDMRGNRNIVIMGIIGKLAFATVCLWNTFIYWGRVPLVFPIAAFGDLTFVILFWMFLGFQKTLPKQ